MTSPKHEPEQGISLCPANAIYTSCYCEENVYLLAQSLLARLEVTAVWEIYVVFISNETRTVALWRQKAAAVPDGPVVWDYHVILVLRPKRTGFPSQDGSNDAQSETKSVLFDFDSTLKMPCIARQYVEETWPYISDTWALNPVYHSTFRIVKATEFIGHFASDRSHMVVPPSYVSEENSTETFYAAPPPLYAPIQGALARDMGVAHNLMTEFVDMTSERFGVILDSSAFASWCGISVSREA